MKLDALRRIKGEEERAEGCGIGCQCLKCAIRTLLRHVEGPASAGDDAQEILLDTNVDGARYLFIRIPKPVEPVTALSPREQEIVRMVSRGCPNKIIADVLNISPWTVCTHLRRIFAKLGVTTRAAMVARVCDVRTAAVR